MIARVPWSALRPETFANYADDVATIYAHKFTAEASGEAKWMAAVIGQHGELPENMISTVLARALRLAAAELEAGSCLTRSGTGQSDTDAC